MFRILAALFGAACSSQRQRGSFVSGLGSARDSTATFVWWLCATPEWNNTVRSAIRLARACLYGRRFGRILGL